MRPLGIAILLFAASGCSSQFLADNARGWREAECDQILDTHRRERCLREAKR
jgi:hypothetical protein